MGCIAGSILRYLIVKTRRRRKGGGVCTLELKALVLEKETRESGHTYYKNFSTDLKGGNTISFTPLENHCWSRFKSNRGYPSQ